MAAGSGIVTLALADTPSGWGRSSANLPRSAVAWSASICFGAMSKAAIPSGVATFNLDGRAKETIDVLVDRVSSHAAQSEEKFLAQVYASADELPKQICAALRRLASGRHEPFLLLRGIEVDDRAIGPTPSDWRSCRPFSSSSPTLREEVILALLGQQLGELFGYASLQGGRLLHNIMPVFGAESDQSGHGSAANLEWHTEDAFTPCRADFRRY